MTTGDLKIEFQAIEDTLNGAYEKNNTAEIAMLLSDDWTMLEPSTGLSGKEQFLNAIADGKLVHSGMKKEVVQIKLYNDFAIVITKGKNEGHYLGNAFNAEQWVTNIYKKDESQWICVMAQEAPVSC